MANLKDLIEEIILEKKNDILKLFYNIDVFIQEFKEDEPETKKAQANQEEPEAQEESTEYVTEEIYRNKKEGSLNVSVQDAKNIQTVDDLLDYLSDHRVVSEIVKEVILIMMNVSSGKQISDIINEGDKVIVDIDYGNSEDDSIGFRINKRAGTNAYSLSIKKDGKIEEGNFNLKAFEQQVIYYRNSIV